ncbi:thiol reductase thioredoxin [Roseiconus nitratireducens]|uniref:Thiol reductase thioredoxin n=2 Tax=Roseiconus nitratireducens TaxID=2605748 RepID=A0A5M6D996_9BACT|nr:thiol reductase thioredoxin [Roseiconus nitratireducens]
MSFDYAALFPQGLSYHDFLQTHGTESQRNRWQAVHDKVELTPPQRTLLSGFSRTMKVLVSAGAWCGDCVNQCPIFDHFASHNGRLLVRFFDRDRHPDLAQAISTCGGERVPSVVFLSEDDHVCGRYGDRTLSTYRHLAETQLGPSCPTGFGDVNESLLADVTQDWLDEFERIQWMLRLSGRLRQLHGD